MYSLVVELQSQNALVGGGNRNSTDARNLFHQFQIVFSKNAANGITNCFGKFNNQWADNAPLGIKYEGARVTIGAPPAVPFVIPIPPPGAPQNRLVVHGITRSQAFMYLSDSRMKKNIHALANPLEKILDLRGVSYQWKDTEFKTDQIGLIAQEVEKIYPEAVMTDPETGIKSVAYGNLIAPLIEAVKEQNKIIESQKQEIDAIKADILKLQKSNAH